MASRNSYLTIDAVKRALQIRGQSGQPLHMPACPYSTCDELGIEVRFLDLPSMEGMYVTGSQPTIFVSALRPTGRQAMTCAHELGHHVYGHGSQYDEYFDNRTESRRSTKEEFLANRFAEFFLMPKHTVEYALSLFDIEASELGPTQCFTLSSWLGVGYKALANHLAYGLKKITADQLRDLGKVQPLSIRSKILGRECRTNLFRIDERWAERGVDLQVGDVIVAPPDTESSSRCLERKNATDDHVEYWATTPGSTLLKHCERSEPTSIRVSRREYAGIARFRFEEEIDD